MFGMIKTLAPLIAVLGLTGVPSHAASSEGLRRSADGLSAAFSALVSDARASAIKPRARPVGSAWRAAEETGLALPEDCSDMPVVAIRDGDIYKNGTLLGRSASSYQANCDGLVAWLSLHGELFREAARISRDASQYDVAWHGDVIVWKTSGGDLYRNDVKLGHAASLVFVKRTGDVVWQDGWGYLHHNETRLGRAQGYRVAARTGDVAWQDGFGTLYRNELELGRAQSWQMADRTGDVGWLDSFGRLHKNGIMVGDDVSRYAMREDGKLIWVDSLGRTHYA